MDSLLDFSIDVSRWLQTNYPQLQSFLSSLSDLGRFESYLVLVTVIYWCLDKQLGATLAYLVNLSAMLNSTLKHGFRDPRPFWIEPTVGLSVEETYGLPSGHAQAATVFYFALASWFRRGWLWLLALLVVFLMALSRVYLGVHDIPDVVAAILLGALILAAYFIWRRYAASAFKRRILGQRLLAAVSIPVAFGIIYGLVLIVIGQPDRQVAWAAMIDSAEARSFEEAATAFGGLFGLSVGLVLEGSRIRFLVAGPLWKRVVRYLLGIAVTLVIWRGLGDLLPNDPLWLAGPLRVLRFFLLALWVAYYAPATFVRLRLANALPKPEIDLTL